MATYNNEKLYALAGQLCPEDSSLVEEVKLAATDPPAIRRAFCRAVG
jgi:hypothetical protein